jgi:aryl-phospho-beta-D-glucosidase BglC (GH1 family)
MNDSMTAFGLTSAGEFSNAINDCGTFLNGVGLGARYDGYLHKRGPWPVVGSCEFVGGVSRPGVKISRLASNNSLWPAWMPFR